MEVTKICLREMFRENNNCVLKLLVQVLKANPLNGKITVHSDYIQETSDIYFRLLNIHVCRGRETFFFKRSAKEMKILFTMCHMTLKS